MDSYEKSQAALFDKLLKPEISRLFRFAARLTHSRADAEDLLQDVLVKVYGRLEEMADLRDLKPWLNRVLYNHFIDNQRRYARRRMTVISEAQLPEESVELIAGAGDASDDSQQLEARAALTEALTSLSDEHRTVILMHDVDGYKLKEIQQFTGEPLGTIKSRLHRARARLRDLLREHGTFS